MTAKILTIILAFWMNQVLAQDLLVQAPATVDETRSSTIERAEQGDGLAGYTLGVFYSEGIGVPVDLVEGAKWFRRSAADGYATSLERLKLAYVLKKPPEDSAEVVEWYRIGAEEGISIAQFNLGVMYANGQGVPENDAEAVKWFRLAAEQGDALAQDNLGVMYGDGRGVPQNNLRAYVWSSVAAAQGHENARKIRDITAQQLTPEQLARGQEIATRCFESDYKDCD